MNVDTLSLLVHNGKMRYQFKKIFVVLMMLWLPLFSGGALAASVSMQMPASCHEAMSLHEMSAEVHLHSSSDKHAPASGGCGLCHLACAAFLSADSQKMVSQETTASLATPYSVIFISVSSVPLLPPPLVRA